jgi:hypothetical protein
VNSDWVRDGAIIKGRWWVSQRTRSPTRSKLHRPRFRPLNNPDSRTRNAVSKKATAGGRSLAGASQPAAEKQRWVHVTRRVLFASHVRRQSTLTDIAVPFVCDVPTWATLSALGPVYFRNLWAVNATLD